jgi:hypothetical protein
MGPLSYAADLHITWVCDLVTSLVSASDLRLDQTNALLVSSETVHYLWVER